VTARTLLQVTQDLLELMRTVILLGSKLLIHYSVQHS